MAEFDADKYKLVREVGRVQGAHATLSVGIWQYDESPPKLRVHVIGARKSGVEYHRPVSAFTRADLEAVLPLMKAGMAFLDEP